MDLRVQIATLDKLLLAGIETGVPDALTQEERAAVRAYLVLGHACIEEFIEDAFLRHLDEVGLPIGRSGVPSGSASLMFSIGVRLPEGKRGKYSDRTLPGLVERYRDEYERLVAQNHGIKTQNIRRLAEGAGVIWRHFDEALEAELITLETLGAKRGEAGHTSPFSDRSVGVDLEIYPEEAREWVEGGCTAALELKRYLKQAIWQPA